MSGLGASPASPSSADRLSGIRAKIERANHHITELKREFAALTESDNYGVEIDQEMQAGQKVFRVKIRSKIPHEFSCIIGDAVHNLRASLDHLIWQLTLAEGKEKPCKQHEFPLAETRAGYKTKLARIIQGIHPDAVELIQETKPYKRRRRRDNLFWLIHHLDIVDKHRHLVIGAAVPRNLRIASTDNEIGRQWPTRDFDSVSEWNFGDRLRMLKNGKEVMRSDGTPNTDEFEVENNTKIAFQIAFAKPKIVNGYPAIPFLHQASHLVDTIVGQFVRFL
jgi:hypothetical protein